MTVHDTEHAAATENNTEKLVASVRCVYVSPLMRTCKVICTLRRSSTDYTAPSDKKSQPWSGSLGISYSHRNGHGVHWNGLGCIWKEGGSMWSGLEFNSNGLGSNVKALNQEASLN